MSENPPPGGGTPFRGNRMSIENNNLKRELSEIKEVLNALQCENDRLRREITLNNESRLENVNMNIDFEEQHEEQQDEEEEHEEVHHEEEQHGSAKKVITYETDEEELERETNWILKKSRKKLRRTATNETISKRDHMETTARINEKREVIIPPPPINIANVHDFSTIREIMEEYQKEKYKISALNNDIFKINVTDEETYRSLTGKLNEKAMQWYTYENKNDRPIRVMLRGLHWSTPTLDIVEDLKAQNLDIIDVVNILKKPRVNERKEKIPLPLFMASFGNKESVDSIYNVRYILNTKVKVESLRKNNIRIPQCKRCQGFNHTQKYCAREPRCVSCAGKHLSIQCNVEKTKPAICINCKGEHPANYRGCDVAKELQKIRVKNVKSRQLENNQFQLHNQNMAEKITNHPSVSHASHFVGHKTFANVLKTSTRNLSHEKSENIPHQEILKAITQLNRRLDEQSCINEKIFDKLRAIEARL